VVILAILTQFYVGQKWRERAKKLKDKLKIKKYMISKARTLIMYGRCQVLKYYILIYTLATAIGTIMVFEPAVKRRQKVTLDT